MKRSHTIKIEDLQNSISEGSIEEINQEQAKKMSFKNLSDDECSMIVGGVISEPTVLWPPKPR